MTAVGAVVVNHDAGDTLLRCIASLRHEGVDELVVVDNASTDGSADRLVHADEGVQLVRAGANLGYGRAANRGMRLLGTPFVLVANPDLLVHEGALARLAAVLEADPTLAIAGPKLLNEDGSRYPSARRFPSWTDAAGHALLGTWIPDNPFSRRYRMSDLEASEVTPVDWVSGACFLARAEVLRELGGFDERYFMYMEDVDLCWRARLAGHGVVHVPDAVVTHLQGLSTARHPYRMLAAHHRSALRFAARRTRGWKRLALPGVALVLGVRLVLSMGRQLWTERMGASRPAD
ncbi:MAG TPA: glycosyltransferase family 2 protein [Acidimicrobiales bacterium]|nr:glycosyltransferase family 2 protein [Acidimicrobiales bacterium]